MRRLWVHEVLRVYGDRLVEDADRTWLFENICSTVKASFNTDPTRLFGRLVEKDKSLQESDFRQLIYCDFTNPKADTKNYVEVQDLEELRRVVEGLLGFSSFYFTYISLFSGPLPFGGYDGAGLCTYLGD